MRNDKYSFADLCRIVEMLRGENGCPWDRVQTHESLERCLIEEAYETVEGIRIFQETGEWENLCEELGDVLLQVIFHAQIAKEEGVFTLDEVIQGISEKMIRRHPHVFGEQNKEDIPSVRRSWEEIKRDERNGKSGGSGISAQVPEAFPALIRAVKVQKKLEEVQETSEETCEGTYEEESAAVLLEQLETGQVSGRRAEELTGELLYRICNLVRKQGMDPEHALAETVRRHLLSGR